jgi:hypothetical protein
MRFGRKGRVAGALVVLWFGGTALAVEPSGSPYQGIVDRNVFGLKPPPPPPSPEDNKPPPRKITLQGITTLLGKKLVLMKVAVPPSKPGAKPEEVPLTLTVGQKQEDVEVMEIHEEEPKWVKVNNSGTVTDLNFKDNGVNLATLAPPAPMPGQPGVPPRPGMGVPPPGMPPATTPTYNPAQGLYQRSIPRTSRGGPSYPAGATPMTQYQAVPAVPGTATTVTTPNMPGGVSLSGLGAPASTIQPAKNWPPETAMTPEEAAIMEAAYTMKYQKEIQAGSMPSIPGSNPILDAENPPQQQKIPSRF